MPLPGANLSPQVVVVVGAIEDARGRVLIARRPDHVHQGGLWEFPGGKLEPGEGPGQGLARELVEELGVRVLASRPLIRIHHDYGDRHVVLDVHRIGAFSGEPQGREGQPLAWVHPGDMDPAVFPAADRPIIAALRLPEIYLITGQDPRRPERFLAQLAGALDRGARLVQLRAHGLGAAEYARLARQAFALCAGRGARLVLNTAPALATDLPCHGIHLTGAELWGLKDEPAHNGRLIGASCHSLRDLRHAADLGLHYALLSPVKPTASHPEAEPLGWDGFAALVEQATLPVYALGGLGPADRDEAVAHGAQGVATIRGLWPEP